MPPQYCLQTRHGRDQSRTLARQGPPPTLPQGARAAEEPLWQPSLTSAWSQARPHKPQPPRGRPHPSGHHCRRTDVTTMAAMKSDHFSEAGGNAESTAAADDTPVLTGASPAAGAAGALLAASPGRRPSTGAAARPHHCRTWKQHDRHAMPHCQTCLADNQSQPQSNDHMIAPHRRTSNTTGTR